MYGDARLRYPMVRTGPKEHPTFARVEWDEALELIASRMTAVRTEWGAEAILPFCYGGSNGMLTHDGLDALFFRRLGASRLARTVCAAPTGAANLALYGKMPSVTYQDYPHARLIVLWGMNPSVSGIHAIPYLREARDNGARIVVVDPRTTPVAKTADLHLPVRPGTDVAVALAIHRFLFEEGFADTAFLAAHAHGADELRERAAEWTFERAAEVSGVDAGIDRGTGAVVRDDVSRADPLRVGSRAQPERRQRRARGAGTAHGRRKVRRARRRLRDEQLRLLGDHAPPG